MHRLSSFLLTFILLQGTSALGSVCGPQLSNDHDHVLVVKESLSYLQDGVRAASIGITNCDPKSGEYSLEPNAIECVEIVPASAEGEALLKTLFPPGQKVSDVFIVIEKWAAPIQPGQATI